MTQLKNVEAEVSVLLPEVDLHQGDDAVTLLDVIGHLGTGIGPDGEAHGGVFGQVLELAKDARGALIPLSNFTFNPDQTEAIQICLELAGEGSNGPRIFRGRCLFTHTFYGSRDSGQTSPSVAYT